MAGGPPDQGSAAASAPRLRDTLGLWFKIGLISFGGPAGQIALLQDEFVDRRRLIDPRSFLHALNFCMLLPGPEAQQLATYLGYRLHGFWGGIVAGGLFILPGAVIMFALAWIAAAHGRWPPLQAIFSGLAPVVAALVVLALWRIGKRTLTSWISWGLAVGSLTMILVGAPFPFVILIALAAGVASAYANPAGPTGPEASSATPPGLASELGRLWKYTAGFAVLWLAPLAAVIVWAGAEPFADIAALFSQAAFVTFGGAYAVLPFVAQSAVETHGWLSSEAMVQGLALAETTPGPLILVNEYVGFLAGWNASLAYDSGTLRPSAAGAVGASIALWCTFLPSFYFVLAGAPLVERLIHDRRATAALAAVGAAVVGAIASLGLLIGQAALAPDGAFDPKAALISLAALLAMGCWRLAPQWALLSGGIVGLANWAFDL